MWKNLNLLTALHGLYPNVKVQIMKERPLTCELVCPAWPQSPRRNSGWGKMAGGGERRAFQAGLGQSKWITLLWRQLVSWIKPNLMACGNQTMRVPGVNKWHPAWQGESPRVSQVERGNHQPLLSMKADISQGMGSCRCPSGFCVCSFLILRTKAPYCFDFGPTISSTRAIEKSCTSDCMEL